MDRSTDAKDGMAAGSSVFDTAPPEEAIAQTPLQRWKSQIVDSVSAAILPVVKYAARPYVGGDTIDDALCVAERLAREGFATTLGYWDGRRDNGRKVADICLNAIRAMTPVVGDSYLSVKPPALRFSPPVADELTAAAGNSDLRIHFDSHGVEVVDLSNAMLQEMIDRLGGSRLGTTLPGRWSRSLQDADWAIERGLGVRVVKGQWPDPGDPGRDMSAGFLDVIDRLAGRAHCVAVATHDYSLAREAISRLRGAATPCEIELLFGMPAKPLVRWAKEKGVKTRIYVPFGAGFVPSAVRVLKRNPRLVIAVAKAEADFLAGLLRRGSR